MASLDGRTLFVDPENPENDLKIISIDRELDRWGGVGFGATLAKPAVNEAQVRHHRQFQREPQQRRRQVQSSNPTRYHRYDSSVCEVLLDA